MRPFRHFDGRALNCEDCASVPNSLLAEIVAEAARLKEAGFPGGVHSGGGSVRDYTEEEYLAKRDLCEERLAAIDASPDGRVYPWGNGLSQDRAEVLRMKAAVEESWADHQAMRERMSAGQSAGRPAPKLTAEQASEARRRWKTGEKQSALAAEYGVSIGVMWGVVHGTRYKEAEALRDAPARQSKREAA